MAALRMKIRLALRCCFPVFVFLLLAGSALPSAAQNCTGPLDGAIGWWQGEGDGTNRVGPVPLTLTPPLSWTAGVVGQAFAFGDGGYAFVADSSFRRPVSVTIEGWFNFGSKTNDWHTLVAKTLRTGTWESYGLFWRPSYLAGIVCDLGGYGPTLTYSFNPEIGRWYHIAYAFDDSANTHRMYVDGTLRNSGTNSKSIAYDSHPVMLGAEYENEKLAYWFIGSMDEVTVWGRALNGEEIAAIHAAGAAGKCFVLGAPRDPGTAIEFAPVAPSPVRGPARLAFRLPAPATVDLTVFDVQGRVAAAVLEAAPCGEGAHEVRVETSGWRPGVYLCRLACGGRSSVKRMVVVP